MRAIQVKKAAVSQVHAIHERPVAVSIVASGYTRPRAKPLAM
jgi:hypothetical protein